MAQSQRARRAAHRGRGSRRVRVVRVAAAPTVVLRAASTLAAGYLGLLTIVAWRAVQEGKARTDIGAPPQHRFVVLVPAHDEERLIGKTLASLDSLDYPKSMVTVHVVADNCSDATASIVASCGMTAHERVAPDDPGKGPALRWLLDRLQQQAAVFDAVVIVDADTIVQPSFLRVVSARLADGTNVVQAYYAVADASSSATAAFREAALAARHFLRPLGRNRIGASAGLYGNGMVFRSGVLTTESWSNHLTEDIEFQLELLLAGDKVTFAPDAVVTAEMPVTLEASHSQHQRWERGRMEMVRRYTAPLLRRACTGGPAGRVAYLDAAVDQLVPPFSVLIAMTVAWGAVAVARLGLRPNRAAVRDVALVTAVMAVESGYVLSALRMVDAPKSVYRALAGAPKLVVWKARLWIRLLIRREEVSWTRTARNAPPVDA